MFVNKCIVFDSASFFGEYSGCSRYAHAFYDKNTGEYSEMLDSDSLYDVFFIAGETYKDCYAQFNALVGAEPLLPIKDYGYSQTQHLGADGNQRVFMRLAETLRERKIPCDNLILDFEWGDGVDEEREVKWGSRLKWASGYKTPLSPPEMLKKLQGMHFDVSVIHHSIPDYAGRCDEDWVNNPYPAETWWKSVDELIADGVKGTWQDTRQTDVTDSRIYNGLCKRLGERPHFLGSYDVYYKSGWTGEHMFTAFKQRIGGRRTPYRWTGDMSLGLWDELAFQVEAITNCECALKGVSYVTNDDLRTGGTALAVRSAQFQCFNSVMRSHNPKPWESGGSADELAARMAIDGSVKGAATCTADDVLLGLNSIDAERERIIREYIKLRYRLIPYIYSAARKTYDTGLPITRPLMIEFESDANCRDNRYPLEYMFGDKLLVAPVCTQDKEMSVYLPDGSDWIDFFTGQRYTGGREITYDVSDIEKMPVFVRDGGIVLGWDDCEYIEPAKQRTVVINVFGCGSDSATLYEDDGVSFEYKKGGCAFTEICAVSDKDGVEISVSPRSGSFAGATKKRSFAVVRQGRREEFEVDGNKAFKARFEI